MNHPAELKYYVEHEWARVEGNLVTVGITAFAQSELGDIVFVDLPAVGDRISYGEPFGSVESVKTVSEIYAPVSGKVVKINEMLADAPEKVNEDTYGDGWMIVVEIDDVTELEQLWDQEKYVTTYLSEA
jgi:glycine cleavage system H protein